MSAPHSMSNQATASCPFSEARCSSVSPSVLDQLHQPGFHFIGTWEEAEIAGPAVNAARCSRDGWRVLSRVRDDFGGGAIIVNGGHKRV